MAMKRNRQYQFTAEQRKLANDNAGLMFYMLGKFLQKHPHAHKFVDVLENAMVWAYMAAVEDYDEGKGVKFSTFACIYMRNRLSNQTRLLFYCGRNRSKAKQHPVQLDEELAGAFLSRELDPHAALEQKEDIAKLHDALDRLPEKCRQPLLRRYYEGTGTKELADEVGISRQSMWQNQIHKGVRLLRKELCKPNEM